ncbi:ribonuclease P protein component [Acidipila sp. EB88]|uniref:ribonuclease P protein component n=1 Tax=Acidipila sp. EB88 TaxID=2305226 RepID=UPI000F5DD51A|nr:ribonuclease P protein component [Acidipila sp. EB88]RRA48356.1 ribonuclease P protein component [Acidipila sp. EB88]
MPTSFQQTRLRKHADYGVVYGTSRKHQSPSLSYFYRAALMPVSDAPATSSRIGITVPKVLGAAPLRNRLKRRLRVAARVALHHLPAGTDVVLHPRPVLATMPFTILQQEIDSVFLAVARRIAQGAPNTPLPRQPRKGAKAGARSKPQPTSLNTAKP